MTRAPSDFEEDQDITLNMYFFNCLAQFNVNLELNWGKSSLAGRKEQAMTPKKLNSLRVDLIA